MSHAHDLTLLVALVALLAAPFAAWAMARHRFWIFFGSEPMVPAAGPLRASLSLLSLGAGAIHLAAAADAYGESLLAGILVSALAWFQLLWPFTLSDRIRPVREWLAVLVNAVAIVGWAASVTLGLPTPPGDEGIAIDLLATSFQLVFVVGVMALLVGWPRLTSQAVSTRSASLATEVVAVMVIVLTTASLVRAVPHGH